MAYTMTKAPSGLTITRNGMRFTLSWKIADADYGGGLQVTYKINNGSWKKYVKLGAKATSYTISLASGDYYPNLQKITFQLQAKRQDVQKKDKTWTRYDWAKVQKEFVVNVPNVPSLSQALDDEFDNVTKFTWNTTVKDNDSRPFTNVEWQSRLAKESNVTDGAKLAWKAGEIGWQTGTGTRASSKTITEDTVGLARNSYTRWFRVRAVGPRGASAWRYAKHVYATPVPPTINKAVKNGVFNWITVNWTAEQGAAHPIDVTIIEWAIGIPRADRVHPANPSWNLARTIRDTGGQDEVVFLADQELEPDECLWVRVGLQHDRNVRYDQNWKTGSAKLVINGILSAPTDLSVVADTSTHRATITATNNSAVPDSMLAVIMRQPKKADIVIGVTSMGAGTKTITVQCPNWGSAAVSFGVYAFQGTATGKTAGGVTTYAIKANMRSAELWDGGSVPLAPTGVTAEATDTEGEVLLNWNWTWTQANRAEISWSKNPNAWESTDEPDSYMLTHVNVPRWRVSGLEMGATYYFRIRLAQVVGDDITYGPYCSVLSVDLSSSPETPVLSLSAAVVRPKDKFTASWVYVGTDGTKQANADICEATINGETVTYGSIIAHAKTEQQVTIAAPDTWETGSEHSLCVRVASGSGKVSQWSNPVTIAIANPITCTITQTSLQEMTIGEGEDERTIQALTAMPLTATVTGAGIGGVTTLVIERADEYHMIRPDGTDLDGYNGETIVLFRQDGESQITIDNEGLIGRLDDGAPYRLVATTQDGYGQTATAEIEFEVHWTHQAEIPTATVVIENQVAKITPIAPAQVAEGDVCDIYRLSIDKPELIVQGGEFGETYVDPYPAIGASGGHRIVHRTVNGDYITEDNQPAWIDTNEDDGDIFDVDFTIIDCDGDQIEIPYNVVIDNSWEKDFKLTRYLGGAIRGDWNPGASRKGSVSAAIITDDMELMQALRRLAIYTGICHVRTQDGSSYAADVQVSDGVSYDKAGRILEFSLTITRVDPEGFDGMLLEDWEAEEEP